MMSVSCIRCVSLGPKFSYGDKLENKNDFNIKNTESVFNYNNPLANVLRKELTTFTERRTQSSIDREKQCRCSLPENL